MNPSIRSKLQMLAARYQELAQMLSDASVLRDQNRYRELSTEYSQLTGVAKDFNQYERLNKELEESQQLAAEKDPEISRLATEDLARLETELIEIEKKLQQHLLPKDPHDRSNVFLEVRAGTGGNEASLFAGDLFRMYHRYAEAQGWSIEILKESLGEQGGYKEVISRISGQGVYSKLKFESGVHRVQRVPTTEAQGRIHTSAVTVAVLPELDSIEEIAINPSDLRIDTYRASGAGGQHVNKTDSAIRITHLPTNTVVECQDERSQHKNRARAMSLLQSRLLAAEQEKQQSARAQERKLLVGSGDRSERIRTYNFPQGRITDHRIGLTLYRLSEVLEGDLDELINALSQEHQTDLMTAAGLSR